MRFVKKNVEEVDHVVDTKPNKSPFKWALLTVGTLFGVAHIGVLGHLMDRTQLPKIDLPLNDYSSYVIRAGKEGYTIEYKANDPKVMRHSREIRKKNGFFGAGGESQIDTYEEYTMDGGRHLQGGEVGKLSAEQLECIKAAGGGESSGKMVGASVGAGLGSVVTNIPYVGWVLSGWLMMFGQEKGGEVGAELATAMIAECE